MNARKNDNDYFGKFVGGGNTFIKTGFSIKEWQPIQNLIQIGNYWHFFESNIACRLNRALSCLRKFLTSAQTSKIYSELITLLRAILLVHKINQEQKISGRSSDNLPFNMTIGVVSKQLGILNLIR